MGMTAEPARLPVVLASLLALTAALIFAAAEGGPTPLIVVPAAILSLAIVETGPRIGLPGWLATLLAGVAIYLSAREFFSEDIEGRLLSTGHLLAYLTAIVLLLKKSIGDLYRLVTLAGLQVALSSVLTNSFWLAGALLGFVMMAVWTMTSLLWERLARTSHGTRRQMKHSGTLAGPALTFAFVSFVAGCGVFLFLPRIWLGNLQMFDNEPAPGDRALVGYTDEVRLGDLGEILESDEPVMEIESSNPITREPIALDAYFARIGATEPLFRGAVLGEYDDGQWKPIAGDRAEERPAVPNESDRGPLLEHRVYLHPIGTPRLFTIGPAAHLASRANPTNSGQNRLGVRLFDMTLSRPGDSATNEPLTEPVRYTVWSQRRPDNGVSPLVVFSARNTQQSFRSGLETLARPPIALRSPLQAYLRRMPEMQPIYAAIETKMQEAGVPEVVQQRQLETGLVVALLRAYRPPFNDGDIALAVQRHFERPEFTYTLSAAIDDPDIDPVLDFLQNRRTGHCEYYASANTLLLQAAGVPARLVSGFKGGEQLEGGRFIVSQLHAHAWCEAWHRSPGEARRGARWTTYDPTPAGRAASVRDVQAKAERRRLNPLVALEDLWRDGIFMTRTQQRQQIYDPIMNATSETMQSIRDFPEAISAVFSGEGRQLSQKDRDSLWGVGRLVLGLVVLAGLVWAARRLLAKLQSDGEDAPQSAAATAVVPPTAWYERFVRLVAEKLAVRRSAPETHTEYADGVSRRDPDLQPVADLATAEYYRVRFGRKAARAQVVSEIETLLTDAETAAPRATETTGASSIAAAASTAASTSRR